MDRASIASCSEILPSYEHLSCVFHNLPAIRNMSQTEATHAESIEGHEPDPDEQKKAKSRRPASKKNCDLF